MKLTQLILLPISFLYGGATFIRNKLFDWGVIPSASFKIPVISVGNISVGGTGKTPHVEYIIRLLKDKHNIATLSRGYKRSTSGFVLANNESSYKDIGDEPVQYKQKYPGIQVTVDESRRNGISILMKHFPELDAVILDDAFQHRYVTPGLSIITTDFHHLYSNDYPLPSGRLRELRSEAKRADVIIITKTPKVLSPITRRRITDQIKPQERQILLFSYIAYKEFQPLNPDHNNLLTDKYGSILMIAGIANSYPLKDYLSPFCNELEIMKFSDHHAYTLKDIEKIRKNFDNIFVKNKIIVTTEKDMIRLSSPEIKELLKDLPVFYIPIEIHFHNGDNDTFDTLINQYVTENKPGVSVHQGKDKSET